MKGLREKFHNKKGFTLVEMLIVVAIVAILVAISIPLVTASLDKAKEATDNANIRAAKACAAIEYLTNDGSFGSKVYYDADNGVMTDTNPTTGYNQKEQSSIAAKGATIKASETDGVISVEWVAKGTA